MVIKSTVKSNLKNCLHGFIYILIGTLLLTSFANVSAQSVLDGPTDPQEMTAFFDGAVTTSMAENHIPGAVVVVVKDGQVFFSKGYGFANVQPKIKVDPASTLFRPGSVSKLFTWTAVMQLVEQGKLSLDEDINTYLDFKIPNTFTEPITLKNLMTHTPGFEDRGQGLFKLNVEEMISLEDYLKNNIPARVFPPGEIGAYSNYGTALAGYIVQRISGLDFNQYVQENIFDPLGMVHSTFQQPLPTSIAQDMAGGFRYLNGDFVAGSFEFVVGSPAGGLSASGLDMARFMIAHLQNGAYDGNRILKEETALQMHSPLYSPDARLDGMAHGFFYNVINGQKVISHGGDTMLFHSYLGLLPEKNVGIFISTNGTTGNKLVSSVGEAFFDHYYPVEEPQLFPAIDFVDRKNIYAGSYFLSRSNFTTIEKLVTRLNPITASVVSDRQIALSVAGDTDIFVETEPGLLVDKFDSSNRMVLKQNEGKVYLVTGAPFVFIKGTWLDSIGLHAFIFIGGILLFLITIIAWFISFIKGLKTHDSRKLAGRVGRLIAALFGISLFAFLIAFASIFMDINPAFGVPNIYFSNPPILDSLMQVPKVLAVLAMVMVIFCVLAWIYKYWSKKARIYYHLLTVLALAVVGSMIYWNMLF